MRLLVLIIWKTSLFIRKFFNREQERRRREGRRRRKKRCFLLVQIDTSDWRIVVVCLSICSCWKWNRLFSSLSLSFCLSDLISKKKRKHVSVFVYIFDQLIRTEVKTKKILLKDWKTNHLVWKKIREDSDFFHLGLLLPFVLFPSLGLHWMSTRTVCVRAHVIFIFERNRSYQLSASCLFCSIFV